MYPRFVVNKGLLCFWKHVQLVSFLERRRAKQQTIKKAMKTEADIGSSQMMVLILECFTKY